MLEHLLFLSLEAIISALIIIYIPYTEIDWSTYMQHVRLFVRGVRTYKSITGDTGPACYPALYVYVFTFLYAITKGGRDIFTAQWVFYAIYIIQLILVCMLFRRCKIKPTWTILLMLISKRIHSVYLLRLFNDCVSVLIMYMALNRLGSKRFMSGVLFWSASVGVKMNGLLYGPGIALILVTECGWIDTLEYACWFLLAQGFMAVPFLRRAPGEYLTQAFDFSRSFDYTWTVNWRFMPQHVFASDGFKWTLMVLHASTLLLFANYRWLKDAGGLIHALTPFSNKHRRIVWNRRKILICLFESNLIGVIFARSLHYQHYSWYYHSAWLMVLMAERVPLLARISLIMLIEYCWNVYPSTVTSSFLLFAGNIILLLLPKQ